MLGALPVATRIEAHGPFRFLGVAAAIIAVSLGCFAIIPAAAVGFLAGTIVMFLGLLTVIGTLISDVLLAWADPRIRLERM